MKQLLFVLAVLLFSGGTSAQSVDTIKYKPLADGDLYLEVLYPKGMDTATTPRPTALFFFGGGWSGGERSHFQQQADYLVGRGMIAVLADYRTRQSHGTTPFTALMDAKSAVRWVRTHGPALGVDTSRLAVGGGSAGGHLAAAAALVSGYNDAADDLSVSSVGNALLLFNPVIDNGPGGYGFERIGEAFTGFSPLHNLRQGAPPTLFQIGTNDRLIPLETAEYYRTVMEKVGSRCDLVIYPEGKHGFFNPQNTRFFNQTVLAMDTFLVSLGYLPPLSGRAKLRAAAMAYLGAPPVSITTDRSPRSKGGPNDYYSEGSYWWPDPANPAGPYVRRDGLANPDRFLAHRHAVRDVIERVGTLTAAYLETGEEPFAKAALEDMRVFFVDPATRMNPKLRYGQAIQGHNDGRYIGIIDTRGLIEIARAVELLRTDGFATGEIEGWFAAYADWLTTDQFGLDERANGNNHSVWWAAQVGAFGRAARRPDLVATARAAFREMLTAQLDERRMLPAELARTRPYDYSFYTLNAFSYLARIASSPEDDLWHYQSPNGSLCEVVSTFLPYAEDPEKWPYAKDVVKFGELPMSGDFLYLAARGCNQPALIGEWEALGERRTKAPWRVRLWDERPGR